MDQSAVNVNVTPLGCIACAQKTKWPHSNRPIECKCLSAKQPSRHRAHQRRLVITMENVDEVSDGQHTYTRTHTHTYQYWWETTINYIPQRFFFSTSIKFPSLKCCTPDEGQSCSQIVGLSQTEENVNSVTVFWTGLQHGIHVCIFRLVVVLVMISYCSFVSQQFCS